MIEENAACCEEIATIDGLGRRVAALEADNRSLRMRARALLGMLAAVGVLAAAPVATVPDTLAANRFALVDSSGRARALWRLGEGGAEFAILDSAGSTERIVALATAGVSAQVGAAQGSIDEGRRDGGILRFGKPEPAAQGDGDDDSFDWVE